MTPTTQQSIPGRPGAWERLRERLEVKTETATLGPHTLELPQLQNPLRYIESRMDRSGTSDLPYWTKIWPAAIVLGSFVALRKARRSRVLELGAGMGVPGLVAACCGRPVVLSDLEPDALEFARAAVELNDLHEHVTVRTLDWRQPPDDLGTFGTVLGSEILYHPPLYPTLVELLHRVLEPTGSIFIAHEERPFGISFFKQASQRFVTRTTSCRVRTGEGQTPVKVYLHALTRK